MRDPLIVEGLGQLLRNLKEAEPKTRKLITEDLRKAVEPIRDDAARRFSTVSAKSASHYGITVRSAGHIDVEQRLRKVTGRRPDWGALQMRKALLPAAAAKQEQVVGRLSHSLDLITKTI